MISDILGPFLTFWLQCSKRFHLKSIIIYKILQSTEVKSRLQHFFQFFLQIFAVQLKKRTQIQKNNDYWRCPLLLQLHKNAHKYIILCFKVGVLTHQKLQTSGMDFHFLHGIGIPEHWFQISLMQLNNFLGLFEILHRKYFDCTQYSFWQCYMCHCNLDTYITF